MTLSYAPGAAEFIDSKRRGVALHQRFGRDAVATEEGHEKGERAHQERRVLEETLSFAQVLIDQPELSLLQIAKTAVDHFRRLRTCSRCDVAAVDEGNAKSPRGGVERDTRTGHPGTHDHEVVVRMSHRFERSLTLKGGHGTMLPQPRDYLKRHGLPTFRRATRAATECATARAEQDQAASPRDRCDGRVPPGPLR